jgi:dolichol-phosphate mannosyltransferase
VPERPSYSVILPSYLEEENLRLLLPRLRVIMDARREGYEILVIDTATPLDATQSACVDNGVRYLNRVPGNAFGDAVRTGIRQAAGTWILFMDADGSHTPEFIPRLLEQAPAHDVVIASRYIDGGYTENSRSLVLMSRVLNASYALVLNLKVKDVSNSFKLYRADLLKELTLECNNFDIVEEILYKIVRRHPAVRIKEVPFAFKKRMFGETKRNLVAFMATYLVTIVKLRFRTGRDTPPLPPGQ